MDIGKVAVLYGGISYEREVSLNSGEAVYGALKAKGIDVIKFDTKYNDLHKLIDLKVSKAFIALHGKQGEDGILQGALEFLGIPYTGSLVKASVIGMDKYLCKLIWSKFNLLVPRYFLLSRLSNLEVIGDELGYPLFIKPTNEGSSIGVFKVNNLEDFKEYYFNLSRDYNSIIAEEFLGGGEFSCSILKGKVLPITEIVTDSNFYDYDAKYNSDSTRYYCPARLSKLDEDNIKLVGLEAFNLIGCKDFGRVDFLRSHRDGKFYLLEVNTIPGMTNSSILPKAARGIGMSYEDLCLEILL